MQQVKNQHIYICARGLQTTVDRQGARLILSVSKTRPTTTRAVCRRAVRVGGKACERVRVL